MGEWTHGWAFVPFLIGLATGYQGVHEKYRADSPRAICQLPCIIYLKSRAIIPAGAYCGLISAGFIKEQFFFAALAVVPKTVDFPQFANGIRDNLDSWPNEDLRNQLTTVIGNHLGDFVEAHPDPATISQTDHRAAAGKLAYKVLDLVGESGLKTLAA